MIKTLFNGSAILRFIIWAGIRYFFACTIRKKDEAAFIHQAERDFTEFVFRKSETRLIVSGKEWLTQIPADRALVVVSNHESYLDIPCIMAALDSPLGFIAKKELARIPFLGFWILRLGGQLIDRENLRQSHAAFKRGAATAGNRTLLIFPEGTRNRNSTVAPFKAGSFRLAFERQAIVLPLCVCGGRRKFEGNGFLSKPGDVFVTILPSVDTKTIAPDAKRAFAESVYVDVLKTYESLDARLKQPA